MRGSALRDVPRCKASSRRLQELLNKVLPATPTLDSIKVPCFSHRAHGRTYTSMKVAPPHEAFAREVSENPEIVCDAVAKSWPRVYDDNPRVQEIVSKTGVKPVPVVLFADGVRYTSQLAGRSVSATGFWLRSCTSKRRHLIAALRSSMLCRCGCRGWCTIAPILSYIAFGIRRMTLGYRTNLMWDGSTRSSSHPYSVESKGKDLGCKAVLLWITGLRCPPPPPPNRRHNLTKTKLA
eukprot:9477581-Pyramimonas_sp.AAC.1